MKDRFYRGIVWWAAPLAVALTFALNAVVPANADGIPLPKPRPAPAMIVAEAHQPNAFGLFGPMSNAWVAFLQVEKTFSWTNTFHKSFKFAKWDYHGWAKVHHLKHHGWDVDIHKYGHKVKVHAEKDVQHSRSSKSAHGKAIVGCIFGAASGTIWAAIHKGVINGSFYWRSQAEHEAEVRAGVHLRDELTAEEASMSMAGCGAGSFWVVATMQPKSRMPLVARY